MYCTLVQDSSNRVSYQTALNVCTLGQHNTKTRSTFHDSSRHTETERLSLLAVALLEKVHASLIYMPLNCTNDLTYRIRIRIAWYLRYGLLYWHSIYGHLSRQIHYGEGTYTETLKIELKTYKKLRLSKT